MNKKRTHSTSSNCLFIVIHYAESISRKRGNIDDFQFRFRCEVLIDFSASPSLRHKYPLWQFFFVFDKFETNKLRLILKILSPFSCSFHYRALGSVAKRSDVGYLFNFSEWQALFRTTSYPRGARRPSDERERIETEQLRLKNLLTTRNITFSVGPAGEEKFPCTMPAFYERNFQFCCSFRLAFYCRSLFSVRRYFSLPVSFCFFAWQTVAKAS